MSQAPAGWHLQPDGRERYWDGAQWTEEFRPGPAQQAFPAQQGYPTQSAYPAQPPGGVQKSSSTTKIVLIVIAVLFALFVGGCLAVGALVGGAVNEVAEEIEREDRQPGGPDNPLEITEGEAFEVSGFDYDPGWTVQKDFVDDADVEGLKVTNNREDSDIAFVEIKLWSGNEVLAVVNCVTDEIAPGTKVSVDCSSLDDLPGDYDRITINDMF